MSDLVDRRLVAEPSTGVADRRARAYCGPAHGRSWPLVEEAGAPAPTATLATEGQVMRYRLVLHPRTRQPARDHLGNYLYMFLPHLAGSSTASHATRPSTADQASR